LLEAVPVKTGEWITTNITATTVGRKRNPSIENAASERPAVPLAYLGLQLSEELGVNRQDHLKVAE